MSVAFFLVVIYIFACDASNGIPLPPVVKLPSPPAQAPAPAPAQAPASAPVPVPAPVPEYLISIDTDTENGTNSAVRNNGVSDSDTHNQEVERNWNLIVTVFLLLFSLHCFILLHS